MQQARQRRINVRVGVKQPRGRNRVLRVAPAGSGNIRPGFPFWAGNQAKLATESPQDAPLGDRWWGRALETPSRVQASSRDALCGDLGGGLTPEGKLESIAVLIYFSCKSPCRDMTKVLQSMPECYKPLLGVELITIPVSSTV